MKLQLAIVVASVIMGGALTLNYAFTDSSDSSNVLKSTAGMMGHVTLTATDEDGNVIAYRQLDNTVVNQADVCIMENLTGQSLGGCTSPTAAYSVVQIGTATATFTETSTGLGAFHRQTGGSWGSNISSTTQAGTSATLTANFIDVNAAIGEAALINSATSASADRLALQQFSAISLGANDDLTVQWTITVDGS
ncbi:hypothetical protein Nisw_04675 [Candidatus Nitrosopumilus sp. SW]|uniref:hypothetical protein n=1 Tax=Candidatus Nitrosopumilus sp. SW TaxID=2508726 RepID=UPI0011516B6C|nr:hypothetical protein [Candidatus Nitrosopumilus sp. SW]QDI88862.1 hypothetical protein Nisw_04675 [Candidatus Nitrosopumilus sp. SW]